MIKVKSCGSCRHCVKHKESIVAGKWVAPFWSCDAVYGDWPVKVSPPYDDPCDKWEEVRRDDA